MRHPIAVHLGLVAAVLLLGLMLTGTTDGVVSADEGAMLAELATLERTGEWTMANPEPEVDPDMSALPLELSERTEDGRWAPFAKHPVHIALLRPAWAVGGHAAVVLVSLAGVVLAAACAAGIAERLRAGTGPAVVWLTGLGSPLIFDGYQVVGHALGAGTFGVAVLLAMRAPDARSPDRKLACVIGAAAAVALTALIRSEGVLAGLALASALAAFGQLRRRPWMLVTGAAVAAAAIAVRVGEPLLIRRVLGSDAASQSGSVVSAPSGSGDFFSDRWSGFRVTILDAGYGVDAGEPLLLVALVLAVAAAAVWRWRRDESLFGLLAIAAAASAVGRLATADFLVPGLLPALPVLAVGVAFLGRATFARWTAAVSWATAGLFVAGVLATQYRTGGTGEWGGRYFAIALSVVVASAALAALAGVEEMSARSRRLGVACLWIVSGTLAIGALRAIDQARDASTAVADGLLGVVDAQHVDATISTNGAVSRIAWEDVVDGRRWLTASSEELASLADSLSSSGVTRLAIVTREPAVDLASLETDWLVSVEETVGRTTVVVLRPR